MRTAFFPIIILFFCYSCTSNPLWNDGYKTEENLSGRIVLESLSSETKTFVWLEEFDIYTYTNDQGDFSIVLNDFSENISGSLNIYFFVHNYLLDSVAVNFTNGRLSSNQSHLDNNGTLFETVYLKKVLSCVTDHQSDLNIIESNNPSIDYTINVHKSAYVSKYNFIMADSISSSSGLIFYNLISGLKVLHRFSKVNGDGILIQDQLYPLEIEIGDELTWTYLIDPNQLSLSTGEYEVYPYFKIEHSYLPTGLVNALGGANMFEFHEDYLNLPCDIEVARLTVN